MQRRSFIKSVAAAAAATTLLPHAGFAADKPKMKGKNDISYDNAIKAITKGKALTPSSKVHLKAPEIAENGAVVPVKITVDSPMSASNNVKAIHLIATKNGNVRVANVYLTPANGTAMFSTRIKLGTTQEVLAIAEMSDGTFLTARQNVKVTIGGCG